MSSSSFFDLTEKAQSEISRVQSLISKQRELITREEAVQSQKGDTYICKRAKVSLEMYDLKLKNAEDEYKKLIAKYEACIALQESIIYEETHKKTPTIIRAEAEIATLQAKIDKIKSNEANFTTPPPLTQAPRHVIVPETVLEEDEDTPLTSQPIVLSQDEMMREFRREVQEKPLSYIDNNFSYCSTRESAERGKGMKDLVPAGKKWDTNIYGPVSDLSRKKQVKTAGIKA
jgi:hypothetical protein